MTRLFNIIWAAEGSAAMEFGVIGGLVVAVLILAVTTLG